MKKLLLLVAVAMASMSQLSAQSVGLISGAFVEKISEDGRYAVACDEGSVYVIDNEAGEEDEQYVAFEGTENGNYYYSYGFGHIFASDYTMVGCINDYTPAFLKNGVWTPLPLKEENNKKGMSNSADAITPDGSRICGLVSLAPFSTNEAETPMTVPCVWDRQADGSYGMYTVLPHPEKDFAGAVPQYITARDMSADGKTIIGTVTDNRGFVVYPIVYKQDAEGNWSYELPMLDWVVDPELVFPAYPTEPSEPMANPYLTPEDSARYVADYKAYADSANAYLYGDAEDAPVYVPTAGDYMTPENRAIFEALVAAYEEKKEAYEDSISAWYDFYDENVYFTSFEFNMEALSSDGKYATYAFISSLESDDPFEMPEDVYNAVRYNTETKQSEKAEQIGYPTSIMSDGSVIIAKAMDFCWYTRLSYVWSVDGTCVPFEDYIEAKNAKAEEMLRKYFTFDLIQFDSETGDMLEETEPTFVSGTVVANSDGTVFASYFYSEEVFTQQFGAVTYVLNLNKPCNDVDAIEQAIATNNAIASVVVTDLNGAVVSRNGNFKGLNKGVYLVSATTADGRTVTTKVTKR